MVLYKILLKHIQHNKNYTKKRIDRVNWLRSKYIEQGRDPKRIKDAKGFNMKYRKRKEYNSIYIPHRKIQRNNEGQLYIFPTTMGDNINGRDIKNTDNLFCKKHIPTPAKDCRLSYDGKKFMLHVPVDIVNPVYNTGEACSLDPGVRVFQTIYGTDGNVYSVGTKTLDDDVIKAEKYRKGITSNGTKAVNRRHRRNLTKQAANIEYRIKNKMNDLHHKLAKFITTTYKTCIIPQFSTASVARLNNTTNRRMYRWGHYSFRTLLIAKGVKHGCRVYVGTEEYTSKTCGNCFRLKMTLCADEVHRCFFCNSTTDRDINAARNIMILNWDKFGLIS